MIAECPHSSTGLLEPDAFRRKVIFRESDRTSQVGENCAFELSYLQNALRPDLRKGHKARMVGAIGFEPTTPCAQVMAARRINDLHGALQIATECHRCLVQQDFPAIPRHSVALGRVWWWAQNWAQSNRDPRGDVFWDGRVTTQTTTQRLRPPSGSPLSCPAGGHPRDGDVLASSSTHKKINKISPVIHSPLTLQRDRSHTCPTRFHCSFSYSALVRVAAQQAVQALCGAEYAIEESAATLLEIFVGLMIFGIAG